MWRPAILVVSLYLLLTCFALPSKSESSSIPCYAEPSFDSTLVTTYSNFDAIQPHPAPDENVQGWSQTTDCFIPMAGYMRSARSLSSIRSLNKIRPRQNRYGPSSLFNRLWRLLYGTEARSAGDKLADKLQSRWDLLEGSRYDEVLHGTLDKAKAIAYEAKCTEWFRKMAWNFGPNLTGDVATFLSGGQDNVDILKEMFEIHRADFKDPNKYTWETFNAEFMSKKALGDCGHSDTIEEVFRHIGEVGGG